MLKFSQKLNMRFILWCLCMDQVVFYNKALNQFYAANSTIYLYTVIVIQVQLNYETYTCLISKIVQLKPQQLFCKQTVVLCNKLVCLFVCLFDPFF